MAFDASAFKQGQRQMWALGDYPDVARMLVAEAADLVEHARVRRGEDVLDVATGSGNVALRAAELGANVTGLDLVPELLDAARARAHAAGKEVRWVEGDAEALPFADNSFDRVLSSFGVIFAPDHALAARELLRVCRPGGTVAISSWTPEGVLGRQLETIMRYAPPPPPGVQPPTQWGDATHVTALFPGVELRFVRGFVPFAAASVEEWLAYGERVLGPVIALRALLEAEGDGRYAQLRGALGDLYEGANEATDGSMLFRADYLLTVATKPR